MVVVGASKKSWFGPAKANSQVGMSAFLGNVFMVQMLVLIFSLQANEASRPVDKEISVFLQNGIWFF